MIQIKNVSKTFTSKKRKVKAIDDISISLPSKGLVFIIGKSGAGKTTFTKLISLIEKVDKGEILYNGFDIAKLKGKKALAFRRKHIGIIFQENNLIEDLTVKQNIKLACDITNNKIDDDFYSKYSDILPSSLLEEKVENLSGGQKQRVAILRGISSFQDILICDEPTMSLDEYNSKLVFDLLIQEAKNRLVIVVTHNKSYISNFNYRIVEISNGKIISDSNKEVKEQEKEYKQEKIKYNNLSIKNSLFLVLKIVKNNLIKFSFTILALFLSLGCLFTTVSINNFDTADFVINEFKQNNVNYININEDGNTINQFSGNYRLNYLNTASFIDHSSRVMCENSTFLGLVEYNSLSLKDFNCEFVIAPSKRYLSNNEVLISYQKAIDMSWIDSSNSYEDNYKILKDILNKKKYINIFDSNNNKTDYLIVGIINTNSDKIIQKGNENIYNETFLKYYGLDNYVFMNYNSISYYIVKNLFNQNAYSGSGIFVSCANQNSLKEYIKTDKFLQSSNYFLNSNNIYMVINIIKFVRNILIYLTVILSIVFISIFISFFLNSMSYFKRDINILITIGISKIDLFNVFLLNSLLVPVFSIVFGTIIYLITIYSFNSYFTNNLFILTPVIGFYLISYLIICLSVILMSFLITELYLLFLYKKRRYL